MPHSRSSCSPSLSSVVEQPQTTKKRGGRQPRPRAALRQKAPRAASYMYGCPRLSKDFRKRGRVIGCGHVLGLCTRRFLHGRGPVWRCADQVQFTTAS
jgi:hypothetical protein